MLSATVSEERKRSGRVRMACANFFASSCASAMLTALKRNAVPAEVYQSLVANVNRSLPTFHRYLKLRKRMMGLQDLHYYDLYAPLVSSVKLEYTPEEAQQLIREACRLARRRNPGQRNPRHEQ